VSILEYQTPPPSPPRWRTILFNFRVVFLLAYIALFVGAIIVAQDWAVLIPLGVITLFQGLFLIGMPQMRWPRATRKRSMMISQMVGALAAALLTFGVVATALCAINQWDNLTQSIGGHILWVIAIAWFFWLFAFVIMWARQPFSGFAAMYKTIIAGTILEVLITIPVDVQVRKRTSCWCDQGTFWAYVAALCVAFWSFGPGLVLLLLTRRLQREGYFSLCRKCGLDLSAEPPQTTRCPKCGVRINHRYLRNPAD
jgi:hypothetical protein